MDMGAICVVILFEAGACGGGFILLALVNINDVGLFNLKTAQPWTLGFDNCLD